MARKRRNKEEE